MSGDMHILLGKLCRVRRSAVISEREGNGDGVVVCEAAEC